MENSELKMSFDPLTIEHLGIKMYSNLPAALAELVANAYDAKATKVEIKLYDNEIDKSIVVSDNGIGMTFEDINNRFLRIGRNRRTEDMLPSPGERVITGKKGLGKLALFGIGEIINVSTLSKGGTERVNFIMDWNVLHGTVEGDYKPEFEKVDVINEDPGTIISLANLKRKSDFNINELAVSLSKLFNLLDSEFKVFISLNDTNEIEITNDLKYAALDEQFSWNLPGSNEGFEIKYNEINNVQGKVITAKTPLKPGQRGITLFARGRLVNLPEFFGHSESSNFFSYATGWLNVDFIDNLEVDVISTDRQSLDWENSKTVELRAYLKELIAKIHFDWRKKRKEATTEDIQETNGVDMEKWLATVPTDKAKIVREAIEELADPDTKVNPAGIVTEVTRKIMPEYAQLHWRYLHPEIKSVAEEDYKNGRYFEAAEKASRLYILRVKIKAGVDDPNESSNMDLAWSPTTGKLLVTPNTTTTEKAIQNGHFFLSKGIVAGCRNPLDHSFPEYQTLLVDTGLFSEKDCLDMLSLLSHLFGRLDNAQIRTTSSSSTNS